MAGAPVGNKNAAKGRRFEQALWREILSRDKEDGQTMRAIAASLVDAALEGNIQATKEIRDTLDGKPAQTILGDDENPLQLIQRIELIALK